MSRWALRTTSSASPAASSRQKTSGQTLSRRSRRSEQAPAALRVSCGAPLPRCTACGAAALLPRRLAAALPWLVLARWAPNHRPDRTPAAAAARAPVWRARGTLLPPVLIFPAAPAPRENPRAACGGPASLTAVFDWPHLASCTAAPLCLSPSPPSLLLLSRSLLAPLTARPAAP